MRGWVFKGRVWKMGDNVDTDVILPGRYLTLRKPEELAEHVFEGLDPTLPKRMGEGDIVVAGRNFGCGSSREHAPLAIKHAGISAVIAESFARIFDRNAVIIGLPVLECKGVSSGVEEGDEILVDLKNGLVKNLRTGVEFKAKRMPPFILEILRSGELVNYLKNNIEWW